MRSSYSKNKTNKLKK